MTNPSAAKLRSRTLLAPAGLLFMVIAFAVAGSASAQSPTTTTDTAPTTTSSDMCPDDTMTSPGNTTSSAYGNPTRGAAEQTTSPANTTSTSCPTEDSWPSTTSRYHAPGTADGDERGTPGFVLPLVVLAFALLALVVRRRDD